MAFESSFAWPDDEVTNQVAKLPIAEFPGIESNRPCGH